MFSLDERRRKKNYAHFFHKHFAPINRIYPLSCVFLIRKFYTEFANFNKKSLSAIASQINVMQANSKRRICVCSHFEMYYNMAVLFFVVVARLLFHIENARIINVRICKKIIYIYIYKNIGGTSCNCLLIAVAYWMMCILKTGKCAKIYTISNCFSMPLLCKMRTRFVHSFCSPKFVFAIALNCKLNIINF